MEVVFGKYTCTVYPGEDEQGRKILSIGLGNDVAKSVGCDGGDYRITFMKKSIKFTYNGKKVDKTRIHEIMLTAYESEKEGKQLGVIFLPKAGFRF